MDLREAAFTGNMVAIRKFIEEDGVPINQQNAINGWTALHWAAKGGHVSAVRFLLLHGADRTLKNSKGETPAQVSTNAQVSELLGAPGVVASTPALPIQLSETATAPMEDVSSQYLKTLSEQEKRDIKEQTAALKVANMPEAQPATASSSSSSSTSTAPATSAVSSAPSSSTSGPLRLRAKRKGEEDFYEIDLPTATYDTLIASLNSELEIKTAVEKISKIRKLPNTLIRKDADVQRLAVDQEIEVETETVH
eukprot:TRINITY_DN3839_c0_g1_i2.p1 TRINITY_DN3839_c0_g1~~TRINITY_DN3839_c0_g1_i2.p1  ORF type:complete len:252 (-),score=66.23 TRINITY_DN3839_c0_g1_i2:1503-2258(-)